MLYSVFQYSVDNVKRKVHCLKLFLLCMLFFITLNIKCVCLFFLNVNIRYCIDIFYSLETWFAFLYSSYFAWSPNYINYNQLVTIIVHFLLYNILLSSPPLSFLPLLFFHLPFPLSFIFIIMVHSLLVYNRMIFFYFLLSKVSFLYI